MLQNLLKLIETATRLGRGQYLRGRPAGKIADPAKNYKYKYTRTLSAERMHEMYTKEAYTLQEIANAAGGLTRERVRQLIVKHGGRGLISAKKVFATMDRARAQKQTRMEQFMSYYGCTRGEVYNVHGSPQVKGTASYAYKIQKNNAKHRGIEWLITLPEWVDIWKSSGHFSERGVGRGRYAMTRIADQGPYSRDNVVIKTHEENSKESREMDRARGTVKMYEYRGNKFTATELAAIAGIPKATMYQRLRSLMLINDAVELPKHYKKA